LLFTPRLNDQGVIPKERILAISINIGQISAAHPPQERSGGECADVVIWNAIG